jgi:hypothetical protein
MQSTATPAEARTRPVRPTSSSSSALIRKLLPRDRTETIVVLLIVLIGATFYHPGQWNQNARLAAVAAFVEPGTPYTGTFRIDGLKDGPRFLTGDWARAPSGLYSNKAPGVSLLGVLPYYLLYYGETLAGLNPRDPQLTNTNAFLLNLWISVFWNVVAAVALLRMLPRLGLHSREGATAVTAVYAFATLVLPFACSVWGHTTAAAFITLGTLAVLEGSRRSSALAGVWFGMALLTEYLAALSLGLAGLFVLIDRRPARWQRVWRFALGCAPPVVALLVYQRICFGSYFTTAASLSSPGMLNPQMVAGLFGVPSREILVRMFFSSQRGLFHQMPILLLSVAGLVWWLRSRRYAFVAFAAANILCYTLSVSGLTTSWHGGVSTSLRYMIVALPFFCVLLPDLATFPYRRTFLLLFGTSAANMFVVAATSTIVDGVSPVYEVAYPNFWRGHVAFNPLLAQLGVAGVAAALGVALVYGRGLGLLLPSGLRTRSDAQDPAALPRAVGSPTELLTRLSKALVLASLVGALLFLAWHAQFSSAALPSLAGLAAIAGLIAGESAAPRGAAIILLLLYWAPAVFTAAFGRFDPAYFVVWSSALAGLLIAERNKLTWSYPRRWRFALILWALTVAAGWPLIALRELDFESLSLLGRYGVTNTGTAATPAMLVASVADSAVVHLLGLLWFDCLFRHFASSNRAEGERFVLPLAIGAVSGSALAVYQGAVDLSFLTDGLRAPATDVIASRPAAGIGLGMLRAIAGDHPQNWWGHNIAEMGLLGAAGILIWTITFLIFLLRTRGDGRRRVPAAAVKGALIALGAASLVGMPGQGLPVAMTFWTLAFWYTRLVDRDAMPPVDGLRPLAWTALCALVAVYMIATVAASRAGLRVPMRAAEGGWRYIYGMSPPAPGAMEVQTERHGVAVVPVDGPLMILTVRAEHADISERPVTARVRVAGRTVVRAKLHSHAPIERTIDLGAARRVVIETRVDRTWRSDHPSDNQPEIGLALSWRFLPDRARADGASARVP